jgi:hypothetical protein
MIWKAVMKGVLFHLKQWDWFRIMHEINAQNLKIIYDTLTLVNTSGFVDKLRASVPSIRSEHLSE